MTGVVSGDDDAYAVGDDGLGYGEYCEVIHYQFYHR
jgi:hypothetical protein